MLYSIKNFVKNNKRLIFIISIIMICSIAIAFAIFAQVTNRTQSRENKKQDDNNVYLELKNNFKDIFNNSINKEKTANLEFDIDEIIYLKYDISEIKEGKYDVNVKIPNFKLENEETNKINKEIKNVFVKKIIDIANNPNEYTTYSIDYVAYLNSNILSLVIKCNYKSGANPQRQIIKCYNYDLENNKLLAIEDILEYKNIEGSEVQSKISSEIKSANEKTKSLSEQGYNVYVREENDEMYKVKNTPNFFLGKDNYLYLVYAYGNNNFTSEVDLVIF